MRDRRLRLHLLLRVLYLSRLFDRPHAAAVLHLNVSRAEPTRPASPSATFSNEMCLAEAEAPCVARSSPRRWRRAMSPGLRDMYIERNQHALLRECVTPIRTALSIANGSIAPQASEAVERMEIIDRHATMRSRRGKFSEWCFVPAVIERARAASRRCVVYSFGIAANDEFTDFYASRGCHVFAFDPTAAHAREWKPNVTFYSWGLRSADDAVDEFRTIGHYGNVSGELISLPEIMRRLGHLAQHDGTPMRITALKIDCEGCEYEAFRQLYCWDVRALGAAPVIDSISVEFHFPVEMRVVTSADVERIRYAALYLRSRHQYRRFQFHVQAGILAGYKGGARWVHPDLAAVGFTGDICCYVYGFVSSS